MECSLRSKRHVAFHDLGLLELQKKQENSSKVPTNYLVALRVARGASFFLKAGALLALSYIKRGSSEEPSGRLSEAANSLLCCLVGGVNVGVTTAVDVVGD